MPNWDIFAAQQVLKHLTPAARSAGYVLSLYGSVLTNMAGDDLDIIASPFRDHCNPEQLKMALTGALNAIDPLAVHSEPPTRWLRGQIMSGARRNMVFEVPFTRVFTRGWLWRKIDVVVYPNLRP
jgi:hypothetical protein